MGSAMVVVKSPAVNDPARLSQAQEEVGGSNQREGEKGQTVSKHEIDPIPAAIAAINSLRYSREAQSNNDSFG